MTLCIQTLVGSLIIWDQAFTPIFQTTVYNILILETSEIYANEQCLNNSTNKNISHRKLIRFPIKNRMNNPRFRFFSRTNWNIIFRVDLNDLWPVSLRNRRTRSTKEHRYNISKAMVWEWLGRCNYMQCSFEKEDKTKLLLLLTCYELKI